MRITSLILLILCGTPDYALAQQSWRTEIGIEGGFTRAVAAGVGAAPTDVVSIPGFSLGPLFPAANGVYAIVPWRGPLAIEGDVAASQLTIGGSAGTFLALGLRANYLVAKGLYAAVGGALSRNSGVIQNGTQLGLQAGLGYRRSISGPLDGRVEMRTTFWRKSDNFAALNTYSVLFGVAGFTGRSRAAAPRGSGQWTPSLGISAGYANVKLVGAGSATVLAFPGYGGAFGLTLAEEVNLPPTLFIILPLTDRLALEPSFDIHRFQEAGTTTFGANLAARLDYAVHGRWYAAWGGNLHVLDGTAVPMFARSGVNVGWGYRFALSDALGGRVELNYTMFAKNYTFNIEPANTLGVLFGVSTRL